MTPTAQRWFDDLTPEARDEAQMYLLKRHDALERPKGTRRRMDAPHILIKKYDSKGCRIATT